MSGFTSASIEKILELEPDLVVGFSDIQADIARDLIKAGVDLPGPGSVFLHVDWSFPAPVKPGDTITATVKVTEARNDKPLTRLACKVVNQEGVTVLEGTALVWTEPLG